MAELRPRLRSTVQIHRQIYRGQVWHVAQEPGSNQFARMPEAAYSFVGLLDGRRTVADAWKAVNEQIGDDAPTQGEAIELLGRLYVSNLLQADLPPDAEGLFNRHSKRVTREVRGYLMNFLFIKIPLFDPDRILERWVSVFGKLFTWYGLLLWMALIATGLYFIVGRTSELVSSGENVLDPGNLIWLYIGTSIIKVFHEFGHGFACKKYGKDSGTGGEVHTMGVMLLVFTPLPYVDASSAWALKSKWQRAIVGAGGMIVELGIAAIAAIVWAHTGPGPIHAIAFNMMFVASVSTLLFNANPLLRFDGYYILSDLISIPNLAQRSKDYLYYLVKRYAWGVKRARSSANTTGERYWFIFYGIASTIYRVFISIRILMFISEKLLFIGAVLAVAAFAAWVLVPLGKFLHYLATSPELTRVRPRAVLTTAVVFAALIAGVGFVPVDDHYRLEGVIEPVDMEFVHAGTDGFVTDVLPTNQPVEANAALPLLHMANPDLEDELSILEVQQAQVERYRLMALDRGEHSQKQALDEHRRAKAARIATVRKQVQDLTRPPRRTGTWVAPHAEKLPGMYLRQGEKVGLIASLDRVLIRAVAEQPVADVLIKELEGSGREDLRRVEIRLHGRPDLRLEGTVELPIARAGTLQLPSAALGYAVGGSVQTDPQDQQGRAAAEPFFEVRITPDPDTGVRLLSGQRVVVRLSLSAKPLAVQWYHQILQLVQQRFKI